MLLSKYAQRCAARAELELSLKLVSDAGSASKLHQCPMGSSLTDLGWGIVCVCAALPDRKPSTSVLCVYELLLLLLLLHSLAEQSGSLSQP